ncbi:mitotic deacetylase-associated SANT domain protein-like isoform X2 [Myxocyprinus asiaticus]|uniref:mitotic deacetylase-associated SANT domain protein-like isoform X2 n=1 Tax=Myxocyprinus asiaticus TaxID=70543 RepID=UPI002221E02D|nr:mitotic deacetylase-associated SANT domain protein-like isoform X2 [Myxocyprinus asiaticus]
MSLSPHQSGTINSVSKQNVEAIDQTMQHSGELFYSVGAPSLEQTHSSPGVVVNSIPEVQGSGVFKSEKGYQVHGHFQQSGSVKWMHQDPMQTSTWFQGLPNVTKWTQNFGPSLSGVEDPRAFNKASHEMDAVKIEKLSPGSSQAFPDISQGPGADWDHHAMAAMHHAQCQALQQGHRPADLHYQPQGMHPNMPDSTLQPFQVAFGPTKQPQAPGFHQVFQGNNASLNMNYSEQPKSQQQLLQLQQQQLHRQHQMQQLQQMRQLQQQQQHQMQQQQQQQQRLQQMQQQYHQQQKMHAQLQQMQQQLQQHTQGLQPESLPSQEKQRVKQETGSQHLDGVQVETESSPLSHQMQLTFPQTQPQEPVPQGSNYQDPGSAKTSSEQQETQTKPQVLPRRSRRLSKDGVSSQGNQASKDKVSTQNGGVCVPLVGVIQSTQRRRRASKEINLETLAQKASEMEFLPAKHEENISGRPRGMVPLVIPVSVPVQRCQVQLEATQGVRHPSEIPQQQNQPEHKPSVIVARRHSLKNSTSESFSQGKRQEETSPDKSRRRPRPEPLVIPPPKPCTFIAPSVYSSITSYQSNLRSPVRLPENTSIIPPYTPPPILSPVREGSGLYFSAVLSSMAAGSQVPPPPLTPRTATRSLLRSISSDITPPTLPLIGEAAPVSLEPRINIGFQYQAEIPDLQDQSLALKDQHKATLVWFPMSETDSTPIQNTRVDDLMNLACSSVLCGGGTNTELAMHCLHECRGDVMGALEIMFMKNPIFSRNHHLANYHYAGSDYWTVDEKRYFNKGISAYRKDFFLVQKLVRSKTVAQCVEFYYTYKKQVKVGHNGTLTYGPLDSEESIPVVQINVTQKHVEKGIDSRPEVGTQSNKDATVKDVTKTLQDNQNRPDLAHEEQKNGAVEEAFGLRPVAQPSFKAPSPAPQKPRSDNAGKKNRTSTGNKIQGEPEGVFPCKKCSRVFYKVKSRSAHMKSHAEQEKKAAALRLKEEEELAAAKARQEVLEAARRKEAQREEQQEESSGTEENSIEPEDEHDEDWH